MNLGGQGNQDMYEVGIRYNEQVKYFTAQFAKD